MAIVCPLCPTDACCHFKPTSPDLYIKNSHEVGKMTVARFAHLNHLVDQICCISDVVASLQSGSIQSVIYCGAALPEVLGVVTIPAISVAPVSATEALTGDGCSVPFSVCIDGVTIVKNLITGCLETVSAPAAASPYAMFFGLTAGTGNPGPTDYAATVAPGTAVPFPQNGPAAGIVRSGPGTFVLGAIGTYEVNFKVHTTEPGQLQLRLNGAALANTTSAAMNPTAGGHPIVGTGIFITTTVINEILEVIVPAGNTPALTIVPADGASTHANAQSISIKQIA